MKTFFMFLFLSSFQIAFSCEDIINGQFYFKGLESQIRYFSWKTKINFDCEKVILDEFFTHKKGFSLLLRLGENKSVENNDETLFFSLVSIFKGGFKISIKSENSRGKFDTLLVFKKIHTHNYLFVIPAVLRSFEDQSFELISEN